MSVPDGAIGVVERDQLERGIRRIPIEQRTVLVFHHYLGLTLAEVADRLGVPIGTVKSRLFYATSAMRAVLEAEARPTPLSRERPA
jgi:RNA polymerase sigma-70 factor (ECF subfamily)